LLELVAVSVPPRPPAASDLGICTPHDSSPLYRLAMSMSNSVGVAFSSDDIVAWFVQIRR
jgi:hypothetical protein